MGKFWRRTDSALLAAVAAIAVSALIAKSFWSTDGREGGRRSAGSSQLIVLEPESWIGTVLPIRPFVEIGANIDQGEWLIVFHRHDCSTCAELIESWNNRAKHVVETGDAAQVAFIEVPDPESAAIVPPSAAPPAASGRLKTGTDWFVQTPAVIRVVDGRVISIEDSETLFGERGSTDHGADGHAGESS